MAFRYTDVNTRAVYSAKKGTTGQAGKLAKFWKDAAGTVPVDIGLYSEGTPETPGASTGSNVLVVQDDGMWPEMWDREGALDHIWVQVGSPNNPGDRYKIYCDADQRADALDARVAALEPGGSGEAASKAALTAEANARADADAQLVPKARTITAGTGLTGGGDLSADRSLAVAYGTTAGTAAQGNDSRLSDARTPTGHAASHASGGADPITVAQSQVSGLAGSLAAKADLVGGVIPTAQIPAIALTTFLGAVASQAAMLALAGQPGDWATRTDTGTTWQITGSTPNQLSSWTQLLTPADAVSSVNGQTGPVTLAKADIGLGNVDNTSDASKPLSTAAQAALDGKVGKGDVVINVADYADKTGVANADAGIAAAIAAAGATGTVHWPAGTYKATSTVNIGPCNCTASPDAIISYTGSGTALMVGTTTSGQVVQRKRVSLPQVVNAAKTATGWAQTNVVGTTGVKVSNLNRSYVDVPRVQGFETGLLMYGTGQGVSYVTVTIGHLDNNKVNLKADKDVGGWSNQNLFLGGSYSHNSNEGTNVSGTRHIWLAHSSGNGDPNCNTWLNPSLETSGVLEYTLDISGTYNQIINGRFEVSSGSSKVIWQATATRNLIIGGYAVDALAETHVSGSGNNSIIGTSSARFLTGLQYGVVFENGGSSNYGSLTITRAGGIGLGDDPVTAYAGRFQASAWKGKRYNDAADRVIVDTSSGMIQIGSGAAAPTIQWSQGSGSPEGVVTAGVGSLYSRSNGSAGATLYVKESGTGNTGWAPYGASTGAASADVQTFTANGTWTKPAGAKAVLVEMIGGGGGGGSGARRATGVLATGGAAGGGSGIVNWTVDAANLPSSVAVTVGAGGTGGAAVGADDTNGNAGANGTSSIFGAFLRAWHGGGGQGGTNTGAAGGGSGSIGTSLGGNGASSSATGAAGSAALAAAGAPGAGAGGGITTGNVAANGGAGQTSWASPAGATGGSAGVVDTTVPTAGGSVTAGYPLPGGSPGGGAASVTAAAQAGAAAGSYGAGGAGGGASRNGFASGAGSDGAPGIVRVVTYF